MQPLIMDAVKGRSRFRLRLRLWFRAALNSLSFGFVQAGLSQVGLIQAGLGEIRELRQIRKPDKVIDNLVDEPGEHGD